MKLVTFGISFKTAPIEIREKAALGTDEFEGALRRLSHSDGVVECVILSTCNRFETFAVLTGHKTDALAGFFADRLGVSVSGIREISYCHENEEALTHLCKVCAGLDSMVLGEPQVLGQVKEAYRNAAAAGTVRAVLDGLFP